MSEPAAAVSVDCRLLLLLLLLQLLRQSIFRCNALITWLIPAQFHLHRHLHSAAPVLAMHRLAKTPPKSCSQLPFHSSAKLSCVLSKGNRNLFTKHFIVPPIVPDSLSFSLSWPFPHLLTTRRVDDCVCGSLLAITFGLAGGRRECWGFGIGDFVATVYFVFFLSFVSCLRLLAHSTRQSRFILAMIDGPT